MTSPELVFETFTEGLAIRGGLGSCDGVGEGVGEALTGARAGWAIEQNPILSSGHGPRI